MVIVSYFSFPFHINSKMTPEEDLAEIRDNFLDFYNSYRDSKGAALNQVISYPSVHLSLNLHSRSPRGLLTATQGQVTAPVIQEPSV